MLQIQCNVENQGAMLQIQCNVENQGNYVTNAMPCRESGSVLLSPLVSLTSSAAPDVSDQSSGDL